VRSMASNNITSFVTGLGGRDLQRSDASSVLERKRVLRSEGSRHPTMIDREGNSIRDSKDCGSVFIAKSFS